MKISTELSLKELPPRQEARPRGNVDFKKVLAQARDTSAGAARLASRPEPPRLSDKYTVRQGDTLFSIARRMLKEQGLDAENNAANQAVTQLVKFNQIANPDLIHPGQMISLVGVKGAVGEPQKKVLHLSATPRLTEASVQRNPAAGAPDTKAAMLENPLLEKLLDRAVGLKYFEATQKDAVRNKIVEMGKEYKFKPDDMAMVMLIESDGMNPQASNGWCYGVIQFCEGANMGAASVGYAGNPRAILKLSVLDQLDLVKKYFDETALKTLPSVTLDDLYLTVLRPASRKVRDPNANLEIPGIQAALLYPLGDRNQPITRASLLAGLQLNARNKLASGDMRIGQAGRLVADNSETKSMKTNFLNTQDAIYPPGIEIGEGGDKL